MHIIIEYIIGILHMLFNKKVHVVPFSRIDKNSKFEANNFIGRQSIINTTSIGKYTYVGNNCVFTNSIIGRFCSISSNVQVVSGRHPSSIWVSSHPAFYSVNHTMVKTFVDEPLFEEFVYTKNGNSCEIGNDVWIGRNVLIMEGVTIGNGAIIAAGSIVTKNVAPYTIVGGSPAKIIRNRFSDDEIQRLTDIEWWNWETETLKESAHLFSDIDEFINNF